MPTLGTGLLPERHLPERHLPERNGHLPEFFCLVFFVVFFLRFFYANIDTSVKLGPRSDKGLRFFFILQELSHNIFSNRSTLFILHYSFYTIHTTLFIQGQITLFILHCYGSPYFLSRTVIICN